MAALVLEEVLREEEHVGGTFGQTAHEIGVPLGAEGDVDADAEAFSDELALQVATDAVEHLELEGSLVDAVLGYEGTELRDDGLVVGGDAAEDWAADDPLHELDVVGVDVGLGREGDFGGFLVGSFAEADANPLGKQAFYVTFGAVEVGLEDGAYGAGVAVVKAFSEGEGGFGVLGTFHVDADEAADVGGVGDHVADDALGQDGAGGGAADVHADLGELDADVGAELAGFDGVEELVVDGSAVLCLGDLEDALAEGVEGDVDAFGVELDGGGDGLVDCHASDETEGDAATEGGALRERAEGLVGRKTNEKRTKQDVTSVEEKQHSIFAFATRACRGDGSVVARLRLSPLPQVSLLRSEVVWNVRLTR